jgi:transforming growth factor-beta-induced protein
MRNHILPLTLCTSIVFQKGQVRNLDEALLSLERSADDKLFVNGTQIVTRDIITTNGIVHIIDGVLLSENGNAIHQLFSYISDFHLFPFPDKPLVAAMEEAKLSSFLDLLSQVGMKSSLDELRNVTVFAPSNQAIEELPQEVRYNPAVSGMEMKLLLFSASQFFSN